MIWGDVGDVDVLDVLVSRPISYRWVDRNSATLDELAVQNSATIAEMV